MTGRTYYSTFLANYVELDSPISDEGRKLAVGGSIPYHGLDGRSGEKIGGRAARLVFPGDCGKDFL